MTPRWRLLHNAGAIFSAAMRAVPRRLRFRAALLAARAATPFVRRTEAYRMHESSRMDTAADIAVHLVVHTLTKNGTEFDPVVDFDGYDDLVRAYREGRGVMLVAAHTALGLLSIRCNHDNGLRPITISSDPMRVPGTRILHETILPSPAFLVTARRRLREGRLVGAMLDRAEHEAERTFEVETANGPVIVSPGLLKLAARCGARVAFVEVHVEGKRLAGRFVVASSGTAEGLTREFIAFVRSHVDSRFGASAAADAVPDLRERVAR